jgi:hypothetical protein
LSPVAKSVAFPARTTRTLPWLGCDTSRSPLGVNVMNRALSTRA